MCNKYDSVLTFDGRWIYDQNILNQKEKQPAPQELIFLRFRTIYEVWWKPIIWTRPEVDLTHGS